ncbi:MAG TPA: hypothetical protein V6D14_18970 [Coleofasciculaceae cyanobacterium]
MFINTHPHGQGIGSVVSNLRHSLSARLNRVAFFLPWCRGSLAPLSPFAVR